MIHYVYFLLNGECRLVEHMLVEKKRVGKNVKYKLYDSQQKDRNPRQRIGRSKKLDLNSDDELPTIIMESASQVIIVNRIIHKVNSLVILGYSK